MGLYEEIVLNSKKKKEEEKTTSFADSIIQSGKADVNKRYESQKQVVANIKSDLQSALYKENQKNGLFTTPVIPTKKASDFINSAMYKNDTENKETSNQYNPYDVKENAKKFQKSLEATKDISDKIATERNTLKYDKYLKTADDVSKEKTTLWDKTGGVVVRGLADLGSSFTIEDRKYTDENGNTIFLPSYNDLKQQKVSEDYKTGVGKFLGDFGYNTTKILGSTALNAVTAGIGGSALYWQDMAVDNYTNAINQGYKGANAAAYSLVSTGLEYAVGKVLGGATGKLTGGSMRELDTALSNAMNKVIGNPTLARIIGTGGSEFTEEFIQEYLDNINKLLILEGNTNAKDYVSILTNPEVLGDALYSGLIGFASGGLVEATNGSDVNRNIKMFTTFKEQLEQRKVGTTDTKTKEQIDEIIKNIDGYLENPFSIDTKTIENTQNNIINLPTAQTTQTTSIEDIVESSSSRKALDGLREQNNAELQALLERQQTLNESKIQEIENEEQRIKNQQLLEETNKRIAELEAQMKELVPTANTEGMNLQESAERYGLNPNSTSLKAIQLMLENRGINARFDSTPFKNSSTNAIWSKDGNGNRSVIFNPKASPDTVLENIAIHELTHDLMSSVDSKKALRTDDLLSYVKSLEGYQEARNDLIHTYSAMYNPNSDSFQALIDEEVVADVLGKKLGNQEFVTRLVNQKPSIARSIYNWVVDKLNSIVNRGGNVRNEKLYWENIKNRFENAYKMSYNINTSQASTMYAKGNYGTALMNKFYNTLTKKQWSDFLTKIKNGEIKLSEKEDTPVRYGDKIVFARIKYGKPQVVAAYEVNKFALMKLGVSQEELFEILDSELSKEGYNEGDIKNISKMFGTEALLNKYDTKSHTFTNTKGKYRGSNETTNSNNTGNKDRTRTITKNGSNGELDSSFSNAKINDYEQMQNEIKSQIDKAYKIDEDFGKNMEKQYKEYREKNQLQYEILKNTKSRQAQNVNDDFFKEHESDYDGKTGTKTPDGKVTSIKLQKGDNLAKLSYTENADKIWIDELYVKNQNQGFGSEIVNAIKEYAEKNGKDVEAFKELSTAKGFWDKTLRNNNAETRYSLSKNFTSKELDKYNVPADSFSDQIDIGTIKLDNGDTLKLTSREFNSGYELIRQIKGTKNNGEEAILAFTKKGKPTDDYDYKNDRVVYDYDTYVIKHLEGAERGDHSGTALLNQLIKEAKENGIKTIVAYDTTHNLDGRPSKTFWEKEGFVDNGEGDHILDLVDTNEKYSQAPTEDNQGRKLSKQQQEYFKNSKVRDENGNLLEVYHGTSSTFNIFDKAKIGANTNNEGLFGKGFYFTNIESVADSYSKYREGDNHVKKGYLNITNPFIWKSIKTEEQMNEFIEENDIPEGTIKWNRYEQEIHTITEVENERAFSAALEKAGYDGIIYEYRQQDENHKPVQEIVAFNSNQFKNVDNTNPTSNEDIRYSKEAKEWNEFLDKNINEDSQGRKLSKEQQEYFKDSEVRDSEGRLLEVYHGTPTPEFTIFDISKAGKNTSSGDYGIFFTDSKDFADEFSYERIETNSMFFDKKGKKGRVYSAYLNAKNVLDFANLNQEQIENLYNYASGLGKIDGKEKFVQNMLKWQQIGNHQLMKVSLDLKAIANNSEYDGIKAKLNVQGNENEYIVFNSNQIKSIDNTNPTSDSDIRYSKESKEWNEFLDKNVSSTGTTGTLMAIHNLSEDKMKGILELGGFPVPSIAVTNPSKVNHDGYGKISILFGKDTIDPANKKNEVYDRDVWSPRFPNISREINDSKVDEVATKIGISDSSLQSLAEEYNSVENLARRLSRDSDIVEKFLSDRNIKYNESDNEYHIAEENGIDEYLREQLKDIYGKKGIYNGKEYITPGGRRRTFWEMHDEYNLENIVKNLTKQDTVSSETTIFGSTFGNVQANRANRFNSIGDIKANESKIMSSEAANAEVEKIVNEFNEEAVELSKLYGDKFDSFWDMDSINYQMQELSKVKNISREAYYDIANKYNPILAKASPELVDRIVNTMDKLKDIPTDYFEAKPQRAVGFDEVEAVVIPNDTTEEFRKQLRDAGLDFVEYNPNVEGDRQRVINKFDNLKFSKNSNGKWQDFVNKHFESSGTTTRLGDIKLPTKQQPNIPTKQVAKKSTPNKTKLLPTQPIQKETQKATIPMAKKDDVIKVASQKIAKQINSTGGFDLKQRSWVGTSTESDILKDKVYIDDLDPKKINYVVQSNKKSLDSANNRLKNNGYEKTLEYVKSIMQSDKLPSASDVALMQRMIQEASKKGDAETVQDLIMNTAIIGTDLGQATQALSIIQRLTPEGQLKMYTKLVQRAKSRGEKSFQNVEITPEMVQNVLEAYKKDGTYDQEDLNKRVEKFKQNIADQMKTTTGEKIDAWRYLSMLGNPKTHIRNMVSNIAMRGTIKVKNAMARTMETILPVKDRTKTWKKASNAVQNFAEETANEMKGVITGENKYNEKSSIESKKQIFKNKTLEKISNFNSNALEAEDWFFSKKAFKDTLQEYLTANNINTQEDIKNNAELVEKAKLYAVEQAEIATFRQYSKLAATIGQLERKSKVGRIAVEALMPFKKTPVNVAKAGVSYSPIGLLKNISYDVYQLKQGNINASQFIDNLAQGLTGTSLTLLGYALAKSGVLTGSGGDDKDDKYDKQLGKTGYSLNIGGNSYSISWLSPVAMPLLVGSNAYEQLEEDKEWDMNVVSDTLAKTLDPLNEMSFMQGLTNALQSYGSGADKIKGSLESTAQNYVGQFFPTLFSQLAATTDDKKRSTKASNNSSYKFGEQTVRSIMYKVPGLRQQLEVATDIWGNEKEQSDNILQRAFESFIAPYSKNKDISTGLDKEIKRVYNATGESGVIPGVPYAYTKYNDETYKMSAKEYTDFKKTYGQTANSTLNRLINSTDYKQASDEDKAKMIDNVYDYARAKANEEYFDNIDINYDNQMLDKLSTLKTNYGINADTYFANKKEYDYAYQNPDKYSVIRQIAKYDKYTTYKNEITEIRNNTSNDKAETIKYINGLSMNIPQKAMFIKQYYKSFKQYDKQIVEYINNQKLTSKEKEQVLTQLGFTVRDGRVYY